MIVYFAHSKKVYGTDEAEKARQAIFQLLPDHKMLDPERLPWKDYEEQAVAKGLRKDSVYQAVVRKASRVVAYEHQDHIGRGVYTELTIARALGKPIHVLRFVGGTPYLLTVKHIIRAGGDWKVRYARIVA